MVQSRAARGPGQGNNRWAPEKPFKEGAGPRELRIHGLWLLAAASGLRGGSSFYSVHMGSDHRGRLLWSRPRRR
jgi:hypothetical protein